MAWAEPPERPAPADAFRFVPSGAVAPSGAVPLRALPSGTLYADPSAVATARGLHILRAPRGRRAALAADPVAWARARGVRLRWSDGEFALIEAPSDAALDAIAYEGFRIESLDGRAPRKGVAPDAPRDEPAKDAPEATSVVHATAFEAIVDSIVARVDPDSIHRNIGRLSGAESTLVGGVPYLFRTRYTHADGGRKAEQWCFEALEGLGLATAYETFNVGVTQARNVVATLPGRVTPERIYIVGGHLDSTSPQAATLAPGAEDNASGTAGVIEAARILRDTDFNSTIKFICFSGEEQGLHGSIKNAGDAAARGDSIFGVVNLDMIGWVGTTYKLTIEGETAWDSIMTVMADACAEYTSLATEKTFFSFGSDHVPYQDNGFAAFLAIEDEYDSYPGYHQISDTLANVSTAQAGDVVRAAVATIAHLAHPVELAVLHAPLASTADTIGPYVVLAGAISPDGVNPDSVRLHWSDGGPFSETAMTPTANAGEYQGLIPGQSSGTVVAYYVSAADSAGRHTTSPQSAPPALHFFGVGAYQAFYTETFDGGTDNGWTHGVTQGSDDWQRATPASLGGDPAAATSPPSCWGTDLTGLGANAGKYENTTRSFLLSPVIDCSQKSGTRLAFKRWLGVERHNNMQWDIASVIVNADTVWRNPSGSNLIDTSWQDLAYDVSSIADGNPSVQIKFALKSDGSTVFCGWNVDDVRLEGIAAASPTDVAVGAAGGDLRLWGADPNPFNPRTTIRFELPRAGLAKLRVFDASGRLVATLFDERLAAGPHAAHWDGTTAGGDPAGSGVYLLRLEQGTASVVGRATLLR
jgi:hypothetical protein